MERRSADIGERLFELRDEHGWTQQELAERAGVSRVSIGHIETGKTRPRLSTLRRLARALGTSVEELKEEVSAVPLWRDPLTSPDAQVWRQEREEKGSRIYAPKDRWFDELVGMDALELAREGVRIEQEKQEFPAQIKNYVKTLRTEQTNQQNEDVVTPELNELKRALLDDLELQYKRRRHAQYALYLARVNAGQQRLRRSVALEILREAEVRATA